MTPIPLPDHATAASRSRAELAQQLEQSCPANLADEIALVGSTARGYADDESDLELNLWAATIPLLEARLAWLQAAGASQWVVEEQPRSDNSCWIHAVINNINLEIGWQTFAAADGLIHKAVSSDQKAPVLIEIVASAIPLRTNGYLAGWKAILSQYSDPLQRSIIAETVEHWSKPKHSGSLRRSARQAERLALTRLALDDLELALRLLYAIYRRWEPSVKWTLTVAREFAPFDLDARIDAILGDPSLERRVDLCAQLCLDVLALVPEQYDVSAAVHALQRRS